MPCALTQGYSLDCRDSLGGITEVYFIEKANVSSITAASGSISALTKVAGKRFYKYELVPGTSSMTENINANVKNGTVFYAQELSIVLNKLQVSTRNEILLLAQNTLLCVVKDNNDNTWLLGRINGINITTGNGATGTAQGDRSGYTLTFSATEKELAPTVASGVFTALTTPGA
jgi:hypothetical protein